MDPYNSMTTVCELLTSICFKSEQDFKSELHQLTTLFNTSVNNLCESQNEGDINRTVISLQYMENLSAKLEEAITPLSLIAGEHLEFCEDISNFIESAKDQISGTIEYLENKQKHDPENHLRNITHKLKIYDEFNKSKKSKLEEINEKLMILQSNLITYKSFDPSDEIGLEIGKITSEIDFWIKERNELEHTIILPKKEVEHIRRDMLFFILDQGNNSINLEGIEFPDEELIEHAENIDLSPKV